MAIGEKTVAARLQAKGFWTEIDIGALVVDTGNALLWYIHTVS